MVTLGKDLKNRPTGYRGYFSPSNFHKNASQKDEKLIFRTKFFNFRNLNLGERDIEKK